MKWPLVQVIILHRKTGVTSFRCLYYVHTSTCTSDEQLAKSSRGNNSVENHGPIGKARRRFDCGSSSSSIGGVFNYWCVQFINCVFLLYFNQLLLVFQSHSSGAQVFAFGGGSPNWRFEFDFSNGQNPLPSQKSQNQVQNGEGVPNSGKYIRCH